MTKHKYYNTTDSPYTMDAAGRILGGGEHGIFKSSRLIQLGVDTGKLLDKGEATEEQDTEEDGEEAPLATEANSPDVKETAPAAKRTRTRTESQEK